MEWFKAKAPIFKFLLATLIGLVTILGFAMYYIGEKATSADAAKVIKLGSVAVNMTILKVVLAFSVLSIFWVIILLTMGTHKNQFVSLGIIIASIVVFIILLALLGVAMNNLVEVNKHTTVIPVKTP